MSLNYTPLEHVILLTLKNNIEQEDGITKEALLLECAQEIYGTVKRPTEVLGDFEKTLLVLVTEELVHRLDEYDSQGLYRIIGYEITRDGLRAVRSL